MFILFLLTPEVCWTYLAIMNEIILYQMQKNLELNFIRNTFVERTKNLV